MAAKTLAIETAPIDDDEPCGPDLDFDEDPRFMQYTASTELVLPETYMYENEEGKRVPFYAYERFKSLDLPARIAAAAPLLERTHDLRLLTLVAKLQLLDRSLSAFCGTVAAMATLLEAFWDAVHPRGEGDDFGQRAGVLERLADPLVLSALNHAVLFRSKQYGIVTWVAYTAAVREAGGAADDANPSNRTVDDRLFRESAADPSAIAEARALLDTLRASLRTMLATSARKMPSGPPNLGKLVDAVARIMAMLDRVRPPDDDGGEAVSGEAPAEGGIAEDRAAPTASAAGARAPALTGLASAAAAAAALSDVIGYFSVAEPSSPSLMLLKQAQALVGKSFLDAITALMPNHVNKAGVTLGSSTVFRLPLTQIAEGGAAFDRPAGETTRVETAEPAREIGSRTEALTLLDQVGGFYRASEPSSPIPLLIDRARGMAGRDFAALLQAVMPEGFRPED